MRQRHETCIDETETSRLSFYRYGFENSIHSVGITPSLLYFGVSPIAQLGVEQSCWAARERTREREKERKL